MKLRDLISEMASAVGEWDNNATSKLPAHFKPKVKKPGGASSRQTGKAYNKTGASTTAPTRKVAPHMLPKSGGHGH